MSDISSGSDPLKEVVEQMTRNAYAAGWKAAMEAVSAALAGLSPPEGIDISATTTFVGPQRQTNSQTNPKVGLLPTVGTTPHYVYQAVQTRQGMTGAEVIAAVKAAGHDAAE